MAIQLALTLTAVAGLIAVGSITPGPNNLVVMRNAARAGMKGALPTVAGIVGGSLALLAAAMAGAQAVFAVRPELRGVITIAGCLHLGALGARLVVAGTGSHAVATGAGAPSHTGAWRMFFFQFLNPKGLVMILTSIATLHTAPTVAFVGIGALLVLVSTPCLLLWSALGASMARWLATGRNELRFDRATGAALIGAAVLLLEAA